MEAVNTGTLRFLLLVALTALVARPTLTSGPTPVHKPFNLRKTSYNFNTTLYWDYDTTSVAPFFQVEYRNNGWTVMETCVNISRNYCDLSEKIVDPFVYYDVRVKAFVGSEESEYAKTEFYLIEDGIIGAAALNASYDGKFIQIDLWYPPVPLVNGKMNVGDYVEDLYYDVYYGDEKEETNDCDRFGCSSRILIKNQTRYCFSALGRSNLVPMTMETSKEICIGTTVTKKVQKPFNLRKTSYNFNTTLYWDYDTTSVAPYFQVEYRNDGWRIVETCVKISRKYCDLSEKIVDPYVHYDVRVKAFVGSEESQYAKMEFYLIEDGIIGAAALNASHDGKSISIDVWYPPVPNVNGKINVGDYVDDLYYDVYYGDQKEETNECDRFGCNAQILIKNQTRYCFSALGRSNGVPMTMETSKEICISTTVTKTGTSKEFYAIVISISVVVIFILVLIFIIIKMKIAPRSMIPTSLSTIAKVLRTPVYLPPDQITRYDQVSVSPLESPEEKMTTVDKDLNVNSENRESVDHGYQSSLGSSETEQIAVEDQNGNEESSSNYYHTENSDSTIVFVKEDDVTEQEPPRDIKPVTNTYGYDKPHCPL